MKKWIYAERRHDSQGRPILGEKPKMRFAPLVWKKLQNLSIAIGIEGAAMKIKAQGWVQISETEYYGYKVPTPPEVKEVTKEEVSKLNEYEAIIERAKNGKSTRDKHDEIIEAVHALGIEIDGIEAMTKKELVNAIANE